MGLGSKSVWLDSEAHALPSHYIALILDMWESLQNEGAHMALYSFIDNPECRVIGCKMFMEGSCRLALWMRTAYCLDFCPGNLWCPSSCTCEQSSLGRVAAGFLWLEGESMKLRRDFMWNFHGPKLPRKTSRAKFRRRLVKLKQQALGEKWRNCSI